MQKHKNVLFVVWLAVTAMIWCVELAAADAPLPEKIDFNRDVRPVLSDNCYYCHGPDKSHRKADLRLDSKDGLLALRKGKRPAVPGKPPESEIWRRITTTDPDDVMPPPETHKKLTPRDIAVIEKWIEQGVDFKGHWAYEPLKRPTVPEVEDGKLVRNGVDRFVLYRLDREGFKPSPEADRATLIRRVSFDITGLPPTSQQVEAFLNDKRPDAYERLVEDMLASPHYGERMAMYWLDLVRFADTVGYHGDQPMNIYPFRDYVIRSFNENLPFDRFTIEQLAGDLVAADMKGAPDGEIRRLRIASGYNRVNMMSEEGGIQEKEYLAKYAADRVRNLSSTWMGSTMGCSECHDHKFDPFAAKDFYRMAAFFADIKEFGYYGFRNANGNWGEFIYVPSPAQEQQQKELESQVAQARVALEAETPELTVAQKEWESVALATTWLPFQLVEVRGEQGTMFATQHDGSILATGPAPERDTYVVTLASDLRGITALRLEVLPDPSLAGPGPGRNRAGIFYLHEFEVFVGGQKLQIVEPTATHSQPHYDIANAVDGNEKTAWGILPHVGKAHSAVFKFPSDLGDGGPLTLTIRMKQLASSQNTIGRFRITATNGPRENVVGQISDEVAAILRIDPSKRTAEQKTMVAAQFREVSPLLKNARDNLAAAESRLKQFMTSVPTTLVTVARDEPRIIRVLSRGNWMDESGEVVEPGVPHFLPQIEKKGRANRLDLAQWLVRKDNPLTARVFVNRLWKLYFGAGLSRNLSDMGSQGEWPTHPDLLDWLVMEFIDSGWDVKHMIRLMVTSRTYRQSSLVSRELHERDPENRLWARQSRFRLNAEMIRDSALAVSGLLVKDQGGPSAKPYQPAEYYAYLNFPVREYEPDKGAGLYRRGVYTWWQRQYLHPALLAFDAPSREECTAERPRSNTPLQALVLLNDPSYVEAARVFAERVIREGGATPAARIAWAMRQALAREATPKESAILSDLYRSQVTQYQQRSSDAAELLAIGERKPAGDLDPVDLAAWTNVARAILNLDETITRP